MIELPTFRLQHKESHFIIPAHSHTGHNIYFNKNINLSYMLYKFVKYMYKCLLIYQTTCKKSGQVNFGSGQVDLNFPRD